MNTQTKSLAFVLLLLSLFLVNYIAKLVPFQGDFTANKTYTLSQGSLNIIENIEYPVKLKFYFSRSTEEIYDKYTTIQFKNYASRVEEYLRQYVRASNKKITLEITDPRPDTKEEEEAIRSGISGEELPNGDKLFFGLVIIYEDQEEIIPSFTMAREPLLEYDVSHKIYKVQQIYLPKLGLISSLPIMGSTEPTNPMMAQMGESEPTEVWAFADELNQNYDLENIPSTSVTIPDEIEMLLVIHPQNLSDQLTFEIDQFILSGKPVFIAVDPSSFLQKTQQSGGAQTIFMRANNPTSSDMPKLFSAYGIEYDDTMFIADRALATNVTDDGGAGMRYPAWLTFYDFDENSNITSQLNLMNLLEVGSFSFKENPDITVTTLLKSSESSCPLSIKEIIIANPEGVLKNMQPDGINRSLAAILRGKLKTAFPNGKPVEVIPDTTKKEEADQSLVVNNKPVLKESSSVSTIFLIGDIDFLADYFTVEKYSILGMDVVRPINDNLSFASNLIDSLAGSDDLIDIRGKGTAIRPFKVVSELQMKAEKNYQSAFDAVNAELEEIRSSLEVLEQSQGESGQLIETPKLRKKVKEFQSMEAKSLAKRRGIRKKLREDIESLDRKLATMNLIIIPALIALFGILFFRKRYS